MKRCFQLLVLMVMIVPLAGCQHLSNFSKSSYRNVKEFTKVMWGSSTKRLEIERRNAIARTFDCGYDACFNAVLELCSKEYMWELEDWDYDSDATEDLEERKARNISQTRAFLLHLQSREKKHIVIVNVEGAVDTTEVGIFFEPTDQNTVKIELSSLSTKAKRIASEIVFEKLGNSFDEVNHD